MRNRAGVKGIVPTKFHKRKALPRNADKRPSTQSVWSRHQWNVQEGSPGQRGRALRCGPQTYPRPLFNGTPRSKTDMAIWRYYEWGPGDYRVRLAAEDGESGDAGWVGLWITDLDINETTYVGSMRFPFEGDDTKWRIGSVGTSMEAYARFYGVVRPIDIPRWHVSVRTPKEGGTRAYFATTTYRELGREVPNSNSDLTAPPTVLIWRPAAPRCAHTFRGAAAAILP